MDRNQLAEKARQLQIPVSENHTRGQLIKIIREDLIQQSTPKGSDYLGFGKHGAKDVPGSSTSGLQLLQLDRTSGGSSIPLETQEILVVAEDAKCIFRNRIWKTIWHKNG